MSSRIDYIEAEGLLLVAAETVEEFLDSTLYLTKAERLDAATRERFLWQFMEQLGREEAVVKRLLAR